MAQKGETKIVKWEYPLWERGRIRIFIAFYDFWVGAFYDTRKRRLYICPLPCCVILLDFGEKELTMTTVTYQAPMRVGARVELQTVTNPGERYAGWIIDYDSTSEWRVVCAKSGQVVAQLDALTVARCFVDLLNEGGFEVVEDKVLDGVQTYKMIGMDRARLDALCQEAYEAAYQAQVVPGPAEFDPEATGE